MGLGLEYPLSSETSILISVSLEHKDDDMLNTDVQIPSTHEEG